MVVLFWKSLATLPAMLVPDSATTFFTGSSSAEVVVTLIAVRFEACDSCGLGCKVGLTGTDWPNGHMGTGTDPFYKT